MRQAYTQDQLAEARKIAAATPIATSDHITGKTDVDITWLKIYYPGITSEVTVSNGHFQGKQWIPDITSAILTVGVAFVEISASFGVDQQDYQIRVDDKDTFKANVSALALEATVAALNDFDPAADTVARVTLVDTTTTNTDMIAAAPTAGEIDTELTSTHGAGSWQSSAGAPGVGAVTVTIEDQFAAPVIGAKVAITDTVGSGNYSGGGTTDGNGEVVIDALATGTYTIVSTANGYEIPDTAVTIGAVAQDVNITADKSTVNAPVDPTLGTLYGDTVKITGTAAVGVEVIAEKTSDDVVYVDSNAVTKYKRSTVTDSNGRFEFDLLLNVELTIRIDQLDYEEDITLTESTTNLEDAT